MNIPEDILNVWGGGQLLAFSGVDGSADSESSLVARTQFDRTGFDIVLPGKCNVHFGGGRPEACFLAGDVFEIETRKHTFRGVFADKCHLIIKGPCTVDPQDKHVKAVRGSDRVLIGASACFDDNLLARDFDELFAQRIAWITKVQGNVFIPSRAFGKALTILRTQLLADVEDEEIQYSAVPSRWPHQYSWKADAALQAIAWQYIDPVVARGIIETILNTQAEDGFVPACVESESGADISHPPLLPLAVKLIHEHDSDPAWVEQLYARLCHSISWDLAHRCTQDDGLLAWKSSEESMRMLSDDTAGRQSVGFNALTAEACEILAGFADMIGRAAEAAHWRGHHKRLCDLINAHLWNAEQKRYSDADSQSAQLFDSGMSGLLPLVCGAPSSEQARQMEFALPEYINQAQTWPWLNLLVARGFERYGMQDAAGRIIRATVDLQEKIYEQHGTFFNYYDELPELSSDEEEERKLYRDYGGSAAAYIIMNMSGT